MSENTSFTKGRLRSSYLSVVISLAMVLFTLGILGLILLNAKTLSDKVRENITVTLMLTDSTSTVELSGLQKSLAINPKIKNYRYINKAEVAVAQQASLGEDFIADLGYNPLWNELHVTFGAAYVDETVLSEFKTTMFQTGLVDQVLYNQSLLKIVNENVRKIGLGIIALAGLFFLVALALINSSIRLAIYSKRFLIRTMQLVGATTRFIRKPFLQAGLRQGGMGALLAVTFLMLLLLGLDRQVPELGVFKQWESLVFLAGGLLILGAVLAWVSTFLAVHKYIKIKTDELY